jgi:hypothetical protein
MVIHLYQRLRGEKYLRTIWTELGEEFPEIFNLCTTQSLENEVMEQEMIPPMTVAEEKSYKTGIPREKIVKTRWIHYQNAYDRKGK